MRYLLVLQFAALMLGTVTIHPAAPPRDLPPCAMQDNTGQPVIASGINAQDRVWCEYGAPYDLLLLCPEYGLKPPYKARIVRGRLRCINAEVAR